MRSSIVVCQTLALSCQQVKVDHFLCGDHLFSERQSTKKSPTFLGTIFSNPLCRIFTMKHSIFHRKKVLLVMRSVIVKSAAFNVDASFTENAVSSEALLFSDAPLFSELRFTVMK